MSGTSEVRGAAPAGPAPVPGRGHGPVTLPPASPVTFDFAVASITVKNPRSLINDTDFASLAINALAADNTVITQYAPVSRPLGNLGKGASIDPLMSISGMVVPDGGSLAVSFQVVNKGGWDWDSSTINALELAGAAVLGALAQGQIVAPQMPGPTGPDGQPTTTSTGSVPLPLAIAIAAVIIGVLEAINILFADCDGTVVPGAFMLGQAELLEYAAPGEWQIVYNYPGTDSPDGCGANSDYSVTYVVFPTPPPVPLVTVPHIAGKIISVGLEELTAAHLQGMESILKTRNNLPGYIIEQSPAAGAVVPENSFVTYYVQNPNVPPD
jgi:hypothetical protein